jgi:aminopeptidase N
MKKIPVMLLITIMFTLAACQEAGTLPPTEKPQQESSKLSTAPPLEPTVQQEPNSPNTVATPAPDPTVTSQKPTEIPMADLRVPDPTLFPNSWDDRDVFLAGLAPGEEAVLQELPGATVYHLDIDITDPTNVKGLMEALYTNNEEESLDKLILHLFPQTLGGEMAVSEIKINGQPAGSVTDDGKLAVELSEPLEPGQHLVLSMEFQTWVPGEESTKYQVLAYNDDILALAHFYPMFAVYDDAGWHMEPTALHGDETFGDSSFYLVRVTAPQDQVIVAGGVEINRQDSNDRQQITYSGGPMRDYYLASSDRFRRVEQQVGPVTINSYAPGDYMDGAELALDVAVTSLQSFSERFGPYPYNELDIVTTTTLALGIEYPGIFANALRIYDLADSSSNGFPNSVLLESTTAHEVGHQWFYSLVGNDQLNEPWLDEALTQYATWTYYADRYGEQNAEGFFESFEGRWARAENPDLPIGLPADAYESRDYGAIVYGRGPIFLSELADLMGQETFDAFMRDYSEKYRWQIAYADDFLELAEQHCDCDLSALFAEEVFGS